MNKNLIITGGIIAVVLIAIIGFAIYSPPQTNNENNNEGNDSTNQTTNDQEIVPTGEAGAPGVVTNASALPYISTVVVRGVVNPNGAFTTYWFEYGQTTALGAQTQSYSIGSGYANLYAPAYITGLKADTTFYYRLSAKNSFGTVNGATYSFKTTNTPEPQGTIPAVTSTAATDVERTSANLHGRINPNEGETTYWFEFGLTNELGMTTISQILASGNSTVNVASAISNLKPETKYFFRLNAQNQFGTVNGQVLSFTTKGPATPSAPEATTNQPSQITDSAATLNATINPNGAETTYWFEYSSNSLLSNIIALKTPDQTLESGTSAKNVTVDIDGLQSNTKYYVRVVAQNQYGTDYGQVRSFITKK